MILSSFGNVALVEMLRHLVEVSGARVILRKEACMWRSVVQMAGQMLPTSSDSAAQACLPADDDVCRAGDGGQTPWAVWHRPRPRYGAPSCAQHFPRPAELKLRTMWVLETLAGDHKALRVWRPHALDTLRWWSTAVSALNYYRGCSIIEIEEASVIWKHLYPPPPASKQQRSLKLCHWNHKGLLTVDSVDNGDNCWALLWYSGDVTTNHSSHMHQTSTVPAWLADGLRRCAWQVAYQTAQWFPCV